MADSFTDAERYEQAAGNMTATAVAAHEFMKQKGVDPAEFWAFFGETYAPGWAGVRGDLTEIARYVALNMTSVGCTTETTRTDAAVTITASWPDDIDDPEWPFRSGQRYQR